MFDTIQSMWVGKFSTMERMCIRSFLRHGHPFHLYVYGIVPEGIPNGVLVIDGNEIVPESEIKRFQNLANFSDYFRYSLLHKKGGWWVDTDMFCLKPFDFGSYVFSTQIETEPPRELKDGEIAWQPYPEDIRISRITSGAIKVPPKSDIMDHCLNEVRQANLMTINYGKIGPELLRTAVPKFFLRRFMYPSYVFCPLDFFSAPWNVCKPGTSGMKFDPQTHAIHLWNRMWVNCDKDGTYPDSLYERLRHEEGL